MTQSTLPRKTRKHRRFVRLVIPFNAQGKNAVVRITQDGHVDEYFLDRVPADFGHGFFFEKRDYSQTLSAYHVHLGEPGDSCECLGFGRWGHCRHIESLHALFEARKV